ncbi:MAG: hypothetical protein ABIO49_10735 [Dokdonella sp.]
MTLIQCFGSAHNLNIHKRRSMTWTQRLRRVFNIDVSTCVHCGSTLRIVASIEEPTAIRAFLAHFVNRHQRHEPVFAR